MSIINDFMSKYPYTDFHTMNLDWLLVQMLQLRTDLKDFVNLNTIKYADPIQWNITTQYQGNTVVIEPVSGDAYLSTQPVPAGVAITDTDYWTVIGSFGSVFSDIKASIAAADEGPSTVASANREVDDLVWLSDKLYVITTPIATGESYVPGTNCEAITVELLLMKEAETRESADALINENINIINGSIATMAGDIQVINGSIATMAGDIQVINGSIATMAGDIQVIYNEIESLEGRSVHVVNSRADVASVDAPVNSYIIAANAYPGDGVRSYYKVTEDTADGFFNIEMDNGRTAALIHGENIHAHQVGAFPDGADCTAAIDAIIDGVASCHIMFGVGRYTFTGRIWLKSNQSISGSGKETILYIANDPPGNHGEFIGLIGSSSDVIENVTLKDFDIDVYYLPGSTEDVNPIGVVYAKNLLIERVNVRRSNWRGFQFEGGANGTLENVIVRDCIIENTYLNGIGLSHVSSGGVKNVLFENITMNNCNDNAFIWIQGTANVRRFTNVVLKNIYCYGGSTRAFYISRANNIDIDGIYFDHPNTTMYAMSQVQEGNFIRIKNYSAISQSGTENNWGLLLYGSTNIIIDNFKSVGSVIGVQIQNGCDNVVISNSDIQTSASGIAIRSQDSALKGYVAACIHNTSISGLTTSFVELS